jgi:HEPN domain-containing protein
VNRSDLQRLSELRLGDAQVLLEAGHLEGAYYLLGYAVECALKSCIAKRIREFDFPDKKLANDSYVHDLSKLVTVAGLKAQLEQDEKGSRVFAKNWSVVKQWSEDARYQPAIESDLVLKFFAAVTDPTNGVIPWLMKYC